MSDKKHIKYFLFTGHSPKFPFYRIAIIKKLRHPPVDAAVLYRILDISMF